jgi:hypothetical protein
MGVFQMMRRKVWPNGMQSLKQLLLDLRNMFKIGLRRDYLMISKRHKKCSLNILGIYGIKT